MQARQKLWPAFLREQERILFTQERSTAVVKACAGVGHYDRTASCIDASLGFCLYCLLVLNFLIDQCCSVKLVYADMVALHLSVVFFDTWQHTCQCGVFSLCYLRGRAWLLHSLVGELMGLLLCL
jgi:hypothetical protein